MCKVLVVPDIHLKPWMIDKVEELFTLDQYDKMVILGDLVDDWNQEKNIDLYIRTISRLIDLVKRYSNIYYCYGNHDVSYLWGKLESGYSVYASGVVKAEISQLSELMTTERIGFIIKIDNVIFSHAGLTMSFVMEHFGASGSNLDNIIGNINNMEMDDLWKDNSPIWARPQYGEMRLFPPNYLQVVGHTPVAEALLEDNLLSVDTFSTYRDGTSIGNCKFVCIDTVDKTWSYVE